MTEKQSKLPLVIVGLLLGLLIASLDNTIVSTAMPTIVSDLGGMDIFSWVFSAYLLTSTTFIPIFGKLADLYGKKRFYLLGLIVFVIGSGLCATANSMHQLIAYRALQGVGAAALFPITFALIMEIFPPEKRGKMQGMFSAVFGISSVAGPQVGAYFTDHLTWHWCFLVNLPIGVVSIFLITVFFREQKHTKKVSIDYAGALTLSLAIVSLMFGLVMGGQDYAWGSWQILSLLIGAGVLAILFLFIETKVQEPVIPLHLFKAPITSSTLVSFMQGAIMITATTYIPLFIQGVIGGTASNAGNLLTPMTISVVVGASLGGFLMQKFAFRNIMLVAAVLMGGGTYLLSRIDSSTTSPYMIGAMIVLGLGIGPLMPVTNMLAQASAGRQNIGVVTSLVTFFRNIGMTLSVSVLSVVVNNKMADAVSSIFKTNISIPPQFVERLKDPRVLLSPQARAHIPGPIFNTLKSGMSSAIAEVFLICIFIAAAAFLLGLLAGKTRLLGNQNHPGTTGGSPRPQTSGTIEGSH